MDWLDLLAVQGTLKSLLQHHSSKASILQHSAFFTVQLSHPYMTTGKTIALTRLQKYIWGPTFIYPLFSQDNDELFPCFFLYVGLNIYEKKCVKAKAAKFLFFSFIGNHSGVGEARCACVHLSLHTYTHKPNPHTYIHVW